MTRRSCTKAHEPRSLKNSQPSLRATRLVVSISFCYMIYYQYLFFEILPKPPWSFLFCTEAADKTAGCTTNTNARSGNRHQNDNVTSNFWIGEGVKRFESLRCMLLFIMMIICQSFNHDDVQLARETNNQFWLANAEQLSVLETR